MLFLIVAATLFLAWSNGANDNFKGVATLYGSGTVSFRTALAWGTAATFAGSLTAALVGEKLLKLFSGSGLVPAEITSDPAFLTAVILGAGLTVFGAARIGIPVSTTHALTGGLTGGGLAAAHDAFNFEPLLTKFLLPLGVAPLIPVVVIGLVLPGLSVAVKQARKLMPPVTRGSGFPQLALARVSGLPIAPCDRPASSGTLVRSRDYARLCDVMHFASAGTVSFARGLNDAPKIAGIALAASAFDVRISIFTIAAAMALGGLLHARRVAETMSHKITKISHEQGIAANMVTSIMVLFASRFGIPVSTTHVSVGAIFGIGVARGDLNKSMVSSIVSAWVLTLPLAMMMSAVIYIALAGFA